MTKKISCVYDAKGRFDDTAYYLALTWRREGVTIHDIAARLHSCPATVSYWFSKGHPPSATVRKRNPAIDKRIRARRAAIERLVDMTVKVKGVRYTPRRRIARERVVIRRPYGTAGKLARKLKQDGHVASSKTTVLNDLRLERKAYVARKAPRLTEANKLSRLAFAKALQRAPESYMRQLCFSDEKWFDSDDGRQWYWCKRAESVPTQATEKFGPRLMVWAAVGVNFRVIVRVPASDSGLGSVKINQRIYEKLIGAAVAQMRKAGRVLQQDNAPGHAAATRAGFFKRRRLATLDGWPGSSPDLNPIETLWAVLGHRVAERGPFGEDELWRFVKEEFDLLDQKMINRLCESFRRRLRACVRLKGATVTARELAREPA